MLKRLCHFLLFRLLGWKEEVTVEHPAKCIICVAPHTSNWDFIIAQLYNCAKGRRSRFLMKREWFVGPLGWMFRRMGGIPVERERKSNLTDELAQMATEADHFELAVTPEGTRSRVTTWKRGFYFIALKASLPVLLYALDFERRAVVCSQVLTPSGNVEADMRLIMDYYRPIQGRHPERFAVEGEA